MDSAFRSLQRAREQRRWSDTYDKQQSNGFLHGTVQSLSLRIGWEFPWEPWSYDYLFAWAWMVLIILFLRAHGDIIRRLSLTYISYLLFGRALFCLVCFETSTSSIPCSYIRWEEIPIKMDTVFVDACLLAGA